MGGSLGIGFRVFGVPLLLWRMSPTWGVSEGVGFLVREGMSVFYLMIVQALVLLEYYNIGFLE